MTTQRPRDLREERSTIDEVPGWAGGVMTALRWVTRLVAVNLLVALGTLAGGVVGGLGPSLHGGAAVLAQPVTDPTADVWRTFWRAWRSRWRHTNLTFAPLLITGVLLWFDGVAVGIMSGPVRAALLVALTVLGVWWTMALAWWPRVVRRYPDASVGETVRFTLLAPLLAPGPSLGALVVLGAMGLLALGVPVVAVLMGVSFPLWATAPFLDARLERIDEAEDADETEEAAAADAPEANHSPVH